jgi:predicted MPP superfamily phosphohydrolase
MKTIVSAGVGAFFPVRVNCPPEVVAVTLRRGA